MFGESYFGITYFGFNYFGTEVLPLGPDYFGLVYFGQNYFGGYWQTSATPPIQFYEQALVARLNAIPEIVSMLGTIKGGTTPAIFKSYVPQTYDYDDGPALTYSIPSKPFGHVLTGSDGTAVAMTDLDVWSYDYGDSKMLVEAIFNGFDGTPVEDSWGNGTCQIVAVTQQNESDEPIAPKAGTDQWIYRISVEYRVMYRVSVPTLS